MKRIALITFLLFSLLVTGCGTTASGNTTVPLSFKTYYKTPEKTTPVTTSPALTSAPAVKAEKILNLGIMVHLEGWDDGTDEVKFRRHAALLREYAGLFEKYGAKLTLESKEMTEGAINWNDNVLLEMQTRGHAVAIHADAGGNINDTMQEMKAALHRMKIQLESLGVSFRHVSGVCSHLDWVTAAVDAGFEFVTGVVSYALLSLPESIRPIEIPAGAAPAQYHESYPFTMEGRLFAWRANSGLDWIYDNPDGKIVIIPSGGGLAHAYEESLGTAVPGGDQDFTAEDITAFEAELKEILAYIQTHDSSQPYTYYLSWSFGKAFNQDLLEQWLQMVKKYVDAGQVRWQTLPEMYDGYLEWEIATGRRDN